MTRAVRVMRKKSSVDAVGWQYLRLLQRWGTERVCVYDWTRAID